MKFVNYKNVLRSISSFRNNNPIDHCVIDDFFLEDVADCLSKEFPPYLSQDWYVYDNPIENKKALNNWNLFPSLTYRVLEELMSSGFVEILSNATSKCLTVDHGLHGGGWHIHGAGGNLNPHLDYSIHPKLQLQRKLNIIVYLSKELIPELHGGHLGLWASGITHDMPGELIKEVEPKFNRAIIFDTTQNSWHGMSRPLVQPDGVYRKSLAIYYLCEPEKNSSTLGRALFAPRSNQIGDKRVEEIIKLRSGINTSQKVYKA